MIKKIKMFALAITIIGAMGTTPMLASAANHSYNYSFGSTSTTFESSAYEKTDNEQKWYLSIDKTKRSTLSSANIFGCKMHRKGNDSVDVYHTFSNYVTGYGMKYTTSVKKGDMMYMRSKKDSASTSAKALVVSGRFAP